MPRPAHFYKFCSARVAKLNLATRRLRFSSPLRFNDPFDCYFPPRFANLRQNVAAIEKRHHAILTGRELLPVDSAAAFNMAPLIGLVGTVPPEEIERSRKTHKARVLAVANQFNHDSQFTWEDMIRRFRVLSLCAEATNPLLWSHYAGSHQGVALEFNASFKGSVAFEAAKPVKYCKTVPRAYSRDDFIESMLGLRPLPDATRNLMPLVLNKSPEWNYEKEWRIVRVAGEKDQNLFADLAFSPRSLSKVFLGCRISARNRGAIKRLLAGDFGHVEIHQARQSEARFKLEFDRIR